LAKASLRRPENREGDFFVDSTCIDCDTCRWMVPEVFGRMNEQSMVQQQPRSGELLRRSFQALLACPTQSIGAGSLKMPPHILADFPLAIDGPIYHLGFHSKESYGATAYLILHPEGNIMVDSPRYTKALAEQIERHGGVKHLFLTHSDDVADHQKFHDHFKCERWLHCADAKGVLLNLEQIFEQETRIYSDVEIITTPGHTEGSCCLQYGKYLFTGDHLAWSVRLKHLYAFYSYHDNWAQLIESMEKLQLKSFEWVLPGHGRRFNAQVEVMRQQMTYCLDWIRLQK